jgi:hypothetical protein
MKNAYKILFGKPEEITPLGRLRNARFPILKYI